MTKTYSKRYFQNIFVREALDSQRNCNRLRWVRGLSSEGRLLEVGCGLGGFLRVAAPYYTLEGMDISAYAAETARRRLGVTVRQGDLSSERLTDGRYDLVAAFNVLEHISDPLPALRKIAAALTPGGWLAGSVPNNYGIVGGTHTLLTNIFDRTHVSTYPPGRWQELMKQAGFSQVRFAGEILAGHNRSALLTFRGWPWFSFNLMFACQK